MPTVHSFLVGENLGAKTLLEDVERLLLFA
jgi:hypothetical protein